MSRMHRHPGRGFDVDGMEGLPAALYVKADGIDDAKGARDDGANHCIIANVCPDKFQLR